MKKYEITKEQLKSLIEAAVCNIKDYVMNNDGFIDDWMKDEFPESFKKELVAGKWYRCNYTDSIIAENKSLIFISEIDGKNINGYGFDFNGSWFDKKRDCGTINEHYQESTPQEVEAALIDEAKKRGYKDGIIVKPLWETAVGYWKVIGDDFRFDNNCLYLSSCIFKDGIWATIIETITIQEAEKLLNKKIV